MKIMATFDGSKFSESIVPLLEQIARLPDVKFTFVSVAEVPHGQRQSGRTRRPIAAVAAGAGGGSAIVIQPPPERIAETKAQAIQRALEDATANLGDIAKRLPPGPVYSLEPHVSEDPAATIIERALAEQPDVIVMATHGHTGVVHLLFGDVAEQVVRSGVAPVLLVHPKAVKEARQQL